MWRKDDKEDERKPHPAAAILLLIALLQAIPIGFLTAGCAANFGRLEPSREATGMFKAYRAPADHRYYFIGPEGRPDAVIALHKSFTLVSDLWTPFDATPEKLKKMMSWAESHYRMNTRYYPYGFEILAPGGTRIGFWYSIWHRTVVEMLGPQEVRIYPPEVKDLLNGGEDRESVPDSD